MAGLQPAISPSGGARLDGERALGRSDARALAASYLRDMAAEVRSEKLLPLAATMVERIETLIDEEPDALYVAEEMPTSIVHPAGRAAYLESYKEAAGEGLKEALDFWKRRADEDAQIADSAKPRFIGYA